MYCYRILDCARKKTLLTWSSDDKIYCAEARGQANIKFVLKHRKIVFITGISTERIV